MMKKEFISIIRHIPARPRNGRTHGSDSNGAAHSPAAGFPVESTGDGHTHANKEDLDKLSVEGEYINITDIQRNEQGEPELKTRHASAGYADEAAHADTAHDVDPDSPVYDEFLRKDVDDTAHNTITFEKQQVFKNGAGFGDGGKNGHIDGYGNAELASLKLKDFLEVPEYRFNRCVVELGNKWNAPGGGIIERCIPDVNSAGEMLQSGTIYLKLTEGERGAVAVGDLCQGIFHDEATPDNNATNDEDDGRGNFKFAGFFTSYFKVTEVLDENLCNAFRYTLRETSPRWQHQFHPANSMHFVAYGNNTRPERQTSRYSTRTYERCLVGVDDWEIRKGNIASQYGDLTNLSLFDLHMEGYSIYLKNVYMSGTIEQFEEAGYKCEVELSGDAFIDEGETKTVSVKITNGYGQDVTEKFKLMALTRDSGNADADSQWNSDFANSHPDGIPTPFTLSYEDMGFSSSVNNKTCFTLIAQDSTTGELLTSDLT